MQQLTLSRGLSALVDDDDYPLLIDFRWASKPDWQGTTYAVTNIKGANGKWRQQLLHRLVMNAGPGEEVIFLDYNGLNCCKSNLRVVSRAETCRHHRVRRDSHSGLKGIQKNLSGTYSARIIVDAKPKLLGTYKTLEAAQRAY